MVDVVINVFRASFEAERALGLLVQISIPSATLVVQEVWIGNSSLHESTNKSNQTLESLQHTLGTCLEITNNKNYLPRGARRGWWQTKGTGMPGAGQASKTVIPSGTLYSVPLILIESKLPSAARSQKQRSKHTSGKRASGRSQEQRSSCSESGKRTKHFKQPKRLRKTET